MKAEELGSRIDAILQQVYEGAAQVCDQEAAQALSADAKRAAERCAFRIRRMASWKSVPPVERDGQSDPKTSTASKASDNQ